MRRLLPALLLVVTSSACKKEEPPAPVQVTVADDDGEDVPGPALHAADALRADDVPDLGVPVDASLVERYLAYRRAVVLRGRAAVEAFGREAAQVKPGSQSGAVRAKRASEEFGARMRAVEELARVEAKLSREEVSAVARVSAEVFSQRQLWKMSGGDEAVEAAFAQVADLPAAEQARARQAVEKSAAGFAGMRDAREARRRYGDAAVDAVLAHEDALWQVQRESMQVMAQVH